MLKKRKRLPGFKRVKILKSSVLFVFNRYWMLVFKGQFYSFSPVPSMNVSVFVNTYWNTNIVTPNAQYYSTSTVKTLQY